MGAINRLQTFLNQLESRLQMFFEGGMDRSIPEGEFPRLVQQLAEAMQAEVQPQPDGRLLVPNVFTLIVHSDMDCARPDNAGLTRELADILARSAGEADYRFLAPPVVRLIADAGLSPQEVQVSAAFSQVEAGDTTTLPLGYSLGEASTEGNEPDNPWLDPTRGAFLIVDGVRTVPLTRQGLTIGRRPDMALVLEDTHVSRVHAQIRLVQGRFVIFDLDSSGGTYVNDQRVTQCVLHPGDVISLAGAQLVFGQESGAPMDDTQEINLV
jgi:hypothetical protein